MELVILEECKGCIFKNVKMSVSGYGKTMLMRAEEACKQEW